MVTAAGGENFSKWLNEKLRSLNTDESVFGAYITGILEGDETIEEKQEALQDIISQIVVSNSLYFRICAFVFIFHKQNSGVGHRCYTYRNSGQMGTVQTV